MIKRAVAFALSRGVDAGATAAAAAALRGVDPLLRVLALRRLDRVLADAERATRVEDATHRLRIAALMLAKGVPEADYDDEAAIAAEHATLGTPRPPRKGPWIVVGTLGTIVVAVTAIVVITIVHRPFDPARTPAGRVFAGPMIDFVVAVNRDAHGAAAKKARDAATNAAARRALGDATDDALAKVLDATATLAAATPDGAPKAMDALSASAATLDKTLAANKLPYFVDPDLLASAGPPVPTLLGFYVQREKVVRSGDRRERVVHLWRLDRLNVRQGYLGYTRASTPAALVLLDQIETELVRYALPAIPDGEYAALVDETTRIQRADWAKGIEAKAGAVLRKHYALLPPAEHADALRVGKLLARRRALIEKWRRELAGQNRLLRVPDRLIPEAAYSEDLDLRVPRDELYEWDDIHKQLLEKPNLDAFLRLRDRYAATVERHEVQHRLDYARGLVPVPPLIADMLGVENPLAVRPGGLAARTRDEMSAYLASLAGKQDSPLLQLVLLSRFLMDRDAARTSGPYLYAAFGIFQGIGQELGIDVERLLGRHGAGMRDRFVELVFLVTDHTPDEIRAAAARCYEKQYGQPVPSVSTDSDHENQRWRH